MNILEIKNLKKSFGKKTVLENISFNVGESEIVGFLGRNGSGKSTTMKCVSGLISFDQGEIMVAGFDIEKHRVKALEQMGVSIENPALYPNLTAYDHLEQMAIWRNISGDRISEMADYTGLGAYLKKPVKSYSMGMKMRLMLALVIMHKPKLIILDEPMNGLDPEGVFQLREELKNLKNQGSSILISSHQLSELEKISDKVVIIEGGRVVFDDRISEGLVDLGQYSINTNDRSKLEEVLKRMEIDYWESSDSDTIGFLTFNLPASELDRLIDEVKREGLVINDIVKNSMGLEDIYKKILKENEEV